MVLELGKVLRWKECLQIVDGVGNEYCEGFEEARQKSALGQIVRGELAVQVRLELFKRGLKCPKQK